ncbi:MAG: tRNA pseudouridine(38-40) synthase TruA [Alphaproteobacteria bacterium]|nr:MAG: tRNA pseudouridine(38-40) synthase TruA [Alphaproteobacteria bacterium]
MTRFRLTIEYDGRPFVGWQRQANGTGVQQVLEDAVRAFTGEQVTVFGAGRTDAGVHSLGQVAHVDIEKPMRADQVMGALNHHVKPWPVSALRVEEVDEDFHARFSCRQRAYRYRIVNRRAPLTFDRGLAWRVGRPLDTEAMRAAARHLVGRHDFTTFRHVACQARSPVKTLDLLEVERIDDEVHVLAMARSFLHHQVRSMVGCLALVGIGKWRPEDMKAALDARDRRALGLNAPPDGLYFLWAKY